MCPGTVPTPRRVITKTLYLSNGIDWGTIGPVEFCEDGSFAAYIEAKVGTMLCGYFEIGI